MKFEILIKKLNNWIKVIQKALIATVIVEGVLVIVIGIASNNVNDKLDIWVGILLFCSVLYVVLSAIRTLYQMKFPGSISEELESKYKLEEYDKIFHRQKVINDYINQSVKSLNDQTCSTNVGTDPHLCDEQLQVRLKDVLNPVISNTHIILNAFDINKFSVGLHLNQYSHEPSDYNRIELIHLGNNQVQITNWAEEISDKGIIFLKDELQFESEIIYKDLLSNDTETGVALEIQSAIKKSLNNVEFVCNQFEHKNSTHTIICSDMPLVCSDDEASGVLFLIFEGHYEPVDDLPYLLRIFNRVVANYVYKYNDCVYNQVVSRAGANAEVHSTVDDTQTE